MDDYENKKGQAKKVKEQGNNYFKQGEYEKAIDMYTTGLKLDPTNANLAYNRGLAFFKTKRYGLAEMDFDKAIHLNVDYVKAYYQRGKTRLKLRSQEAFKDFVKVLKLQPKNVNGKMELMKIKAKEYFKDAEYDKAIKLYTAGIVIVPSDSTFTCKRGVCFICLRRYPEAEKDLNAALRLNSSYTRAYYCRGIAKMELGKIKEAVDDFMHVLEKDPENNGAKRELLKMKRSIPIQLNKTLDYYIAKLLEDMFGSKAVVGVRRFFIMLQEDVIFKIVEEGSRRKDTGSRSEGLYHDTSDIDRMFVLGQYQVFENSQEINKCPGTLIPLLLSPCAESPGYCRLQVFEKYIPIIGNHLVEKYENNVFLSSTSVKQKYFPYQLDVHGPCLAWTDPAGQDYDFCMAIPFPSWSSEASEWVHRSRKSGWPSGDLIPSIINKGCYVVPKGPTNSITEDIEWRISFALAERTLIYTFNHTQFLMYNALKILLKERINKELPDIITSYFLKTAMFWVLEETNKHVFVYGRFWFCMELCIRKLEQFVREENLPNFFVMGNNMIRDKMNPSIKSRLLSILSSFIKEGIACIFTCPSFYNQYEFTRIQKQSITKGIKAYTLASTYIGFFRNFSIEDTVSDSCKPWITVPQIENISDVTFQLAERYLPVSLRDDIYRHVLSKVFMEAASLLDSDIVNTRFSNKLRYKASKIIQQFYIFGTSVDVTAGKLKLATHVKSIGCPHKALSVVENVLSNCTTIVRYTSSSGSNMKEHNEYLFYNDDLALPDLYKRCVAQPIILHKYSKVLPAFQYEFFNKDECINVEPLVYAYYLQAECYKEVSDLNGFNKCVDLIKDVVSSDEHKEQLELSHSVIGYLRKLQGDYNTAVKHFGISYRIRLKFDEQSPHDEENKQLSTRACLLQIACLLYRDFKKC